MIEEIGKEDGYRYYHDRTATESLINREQHKIVLTTKDLKKFLETVVGVYNPQGEYGKNV